MNFYSSWSAVTLSTTGAWTAVDLNALHSVPTNASFAILRVNCANASTYVGFRAYGSSTNILEFWGEGYSSADGVTQDVICPLKSGSFEYYTSVNNLTCYLVGYFEAEGVSLTDPVDVTPADPGAPADHPLLDGAWETIDCSGTIPTGNKWAVIQVTRNFSQTPASGINIRKTGEAEKYATYNGYNTRNSWFIVPLDASAQFDIYGGDVDRTSYPTASSSIYIHGYFTGGTNTSAGVSAVAYTDAGTWQTKTSGFTSKALVLWKLSHASGTPHPGSMASMGWRGNGVTAEYFADSCVNQTMVVQTDGSGNYQVQISAPPNVTTAFYEFGTIEQGATTHEEQVTEDAVAADTLDESFHTPEVTESPVATDRTNKWNREDPPTDDAVATDALIGAKCVAPPDDDAIATDTLAVARQMNMSEDPVAADILSYSRIGTTLATSRGTIGAVSGDGTGLFGNIVSVSTSVEIRGYGDGHTGYITSGSAALPVLATGSDDDGVGYGRWGGIAESLGQVLVAGDGTGLFGGLASGNAQVFVISDDSDSYSGLVGSGSARIYVIVGSGVASPVGYGEFTGSGSARLGVRSRVTRVESAGLAYSGGQPSVIVMDLGSGSVTEHTTQFNSWIRVGNKVYAASSSGIHVVGALPTDNGTAIAAEIAKDGVSGGAPFEKYFTDMYLLARSEGDYGVTVFSERTSGTNTMVDGIDRSHGAKVNLPRGVSGRVLGYAIRNSGGADFEIYEIEVLVTISENRRGRQVGARR